MLEPQELADLVQQPGSDSTESVQLSIGPPEGTSLTSRAPRLFVSYSWDDEAHKQWVSHLASRLVNDGVDVILDQWIVRLGSNLPAFMAKSYAQADFILLVLTPDYKQKEARGRGGVHFEASMVTGEMLSDSPDGRFIPALRRGSWGDATPPWAIGLNRLDLSGNPYAESQYRALLEHLQGIRPTRRPRGPVSVDTRGDLVRDLKGVLASCVVANACQWQLKESQVVKGIAKPDASGYYPVLVGLELLTISRSSITRQQRNDLIAWSLVGSTLTGNQGGFY